MDIEVLTVSSKGQIVLPVGIRKSMNIKAGAKLAVHVSGDIIMLKPVNMPSPNEFESRLSEAVDWVSSLE
ncbi:MAG: AbrB/MazE/SpoVT family DNA-binding domain-containing protein [Eubacteriaceae bacterium]|nr:AbrB/MazE/SpoVT family DNA-binding domain-containing protein [Eubacteriaceae bacterium]MCR4893352.1 AbrB/MazE/SpoVT family DNA-binding domain-containing protein [Eubacteriales bacterium]